MALEDVDLTWIRDEIGTAVPPSNGQLEAWFDELGSRTRVAIRVRKRRFAELAGGEVASVNLAGVASVSLRSNLTALRAQIAILEGLAAEEEGSDGAPGARVRRMTRSYR